MKRTAPEDALGDPVKHQRIEQADSIAYVLSAPEFLVQILEEIPMDDQLIKIAPVSNLWCDITCSILLYRGIRKLGFRGGVVHLHPTAMTEAIYVLDEFLRSVFDQLHQTYIPFGKEGRVVRSIPCIEVPIVRDYQVQDPIDPNVKPQHFCSKLGPHFGITRQEAEQEEAGFLFVF